MDFNFIGLVNRVLLMGQQAAISSMSTDTGSQAYRAQLAVNDTIRDLSVRLRIKTRMIEFTFDTVASQRVYALPKRVNYPLYTLRDKTNNRLYTPISTFDMDAVLPNDTSTGSGLNYYLDEVEGVTNQPSSSGEVVYCVSSSTSDTSTVVIQGQNTSDNFVSEEVSLNGTTAVASSNTYKHIDSISKITTTGTITFRNSGSTTTFLTLSPKETSLRRYIIGISPVPSAVVTLYGRGWLAIPPLTNEYDVPIGLVEDHVNAIVSGAFARFMQYDPKVDSTGPAMLWEIYENEVGKIQGADSRDGTIKFMKSPRWMGTKGTYFRPLERDGR